MKVNLIIGLALMKPGYKPKTQYEALAWLIEECGEVLQASGKLMRFGSLSRHPDSPEGETNLEALLRELQDLKLAIAEAEKQLNDDPQKVVI